MKDCFFTLGNKARVETIIKKSRFLTSAAPVHNEQEAIDFINQVKSEHNKATHNVFAYIIGERVQKYNDDGEPAGTAGMPVLEVMLHKQLLQTVLVVTRYFGGKKLGAGGLVRAYKEAAARGISAAGVIKKLLYRELLFTVGYSHLGMVKNEVEATGGRNMSLNYGGKVEIAVFLRPSVVKTLSQRVMNITAAQVDIKLGRYRYLKDL